MKKKILSVVLIVSMLIITACGNSRPRDDKNKNITKEIKKTAVNNCDIYCDFSVNMLDYLDIDSKSYVDVVYSAAAVARSLWYESNTKVFAVADKLKECDLDQFRNILSNEKNYSDVPHNILENALKNTGMDKVTLIVTDLQFWLSDYSTVSELFVNNVLKKGMSVGFIGVELELDSSTGRTFFILAIAESQNLSDFITGFKQHDTIMRYSGEATDLQLDKVEMINYQIIANKSGIYGIDYENVEFIENGYYPGPDGNLDWMEYKGSFTVPNTSYTEDEMRKEIEGTVNFSPNAQKFVNCKKAKYLGAKSLIYSGMKDLSGPVAGKLKLKVPFNVINGVKLSKIQCEVGTELYDGSSGKFRKIANDCLQATLADAVTPEQGKWRVDDRTNSVVLNILVPDIMKLPIKKGALKLDISFTHNDTIDSVSNWVRSWDKRGCENLLNLFDSLYNYQRQANSAENTLTVYLAPGDSRFTKKLS